MDYFVARGRADSLTDIFECRSREFSIMRNANGSLVCLIRYPRITNLYIILDIWFHKNGKCYKFGQELYVYLLNCLIYLILAEDATFIVVFFFFKMEKFASVIVQTEIHFISLWNFFYVCILSISELSSLMAYKTKETTSFAIHVHQIITY